MKNDVSASTSAMQEDDLRFDAFDSEDLDFGTEEDEEKKEEQFLPTAFRYLSDFAKWSSEKKDHR